MIQKQVFKTRITNSSTFAFTFIRTLANLETLVNNNLLSISMETISYADFVALYEKITNRNNKTLFSDTHFDVNRIPNYKTLILNNCLSD